MKSKVEKYIPGVFGHAVYRNGEWTVYGGQSAQTFEDEFVFCIDEDILEELQDDEPVYASVGHFEDSKREGETSFYTTKREVLDASRELLGREGIPASKANINQLAKDAICVSEWFDIISLIENELASVIEPSDFSVTHG